MDAEEILARARTERPQDWMIFPLLRRKIIMGIFGWSFGILLGAGLLAIVAPAVIPYNYQQGTLSSIVTTLLLGVLVFIVVGSVILLVTDIFRIVHADEHLIVITARDFVKREGKKLTYVPLADVMHVTPRGRAPLERSAAERVDVQKLPGVAENVVGTFLGHGLMPSGMKWRRARMRTPSSLAFIDARTGREVTVVQDDAYGDPFMIAAVLKQYVAALNA